MAYKIIKHGMKEFNSICSRCGCEFTYNVEDISMSSTIQCPECFKLLFHKEFGINMNTVNKKKGS